MSEWSVLSKEGRTLFGCGRGLPIRNVTAGPSHGERRCVEELLHSVNADARFYCDDVLFKASKPLQELINLIHHIETKYYMGRINKCPKWDEHWGCATSPMKNCDSCSSADWHDEKNKSPRQAEISQAAEKYGGILTMKDGTQIVNEPRKQDFIDGAEWADKTMIEKACEWLGSHIWDLKLGIRSDIGKMFVELFRKAMEE